MKIAIVQDELVRKGGAEQVVLSFAKAFPEAPIYTLSYNADNTYPEFKQHQIITSWFGKLIKGENNLKKFFFPFGIAAMKTLNVEGYDVVLASTTHCAKYVKVDASALVITYCHTPFRLVWRPDSYEQVKKSSSLKRSLYNFVINILRKIDQSSAKRTDWFLTNAKEIIPRIVEAYAPKTEVTVIHPAVKCENFHVSEHIEDYFLVVSRFEPYKKVDLIIEAFNAMPNKKIVIIGKGSKEKELKEMAGKNITFKSGLGKEELANFYSKAKALIFPQLEDYGITPLESAASGRPVIAYGFGGVLETMIPYEEDASKATALFFYEQEKQSLIDVVEKFEQLKFDSEFIRHHAEGYDESVFVKKLQNFVNEKYKLKISFENCGKWH